MSYHRGPPYSPSGYYPPDPPQFSDPRAGPPYLTQTSQRYPHQSPGSPASYLSCSAYPAPSYPQHSSYDLAGARSSARMSSYSRTQEFPSSSGGPPSHSTHQRTQASIAQPQLQSQLRDVGGNRVQHRSSILPSRIHADGTRPLMNVGNNATHATVFGQNIHLYDENTTFRLSEAEFTDPRKPRWVEGCEHLAFENQGMRRPSIQRHFEGIQRLTLVGGRSPLARDEWIILDLKPIVQNLERGMGVRRGRLTKLRRRWRDVLKRVEPGMLNVFSVHSHAFKKLLPTEFLTCKVRPGLGTQVHPRVLFVDAELRSASRILVPGGLGVIESHGLESIRWDSDDFVRT